MLKGRTSKYAIWRACERIGIRPPSVPAAWDEIETAPVICDILAYSQLREEEEAQ